MVSAIEADFISSQTSPGKHYILWDLMHECLELYGQIDPFVVLNLLNFMITNNKFFNFAFF